MANLYTKMKTVALMGGGKDSCFNMMCCIAEGHEIVALANLRPANAEEIDSYMFQTVGHTAIDLYAEALDLPLFRRIIRGSSISVGPVYEPNSGDEVEDLMELLQQIKNEHRIEAVSVGAILSDYQRVRVEYVCDLLGLKVLAFLWRRDQEELLQEMIDCGVKAKIIKVASMGLTPKKHLMLDLEEILPHMKNLHSDYGTNICGEGGEYETFVYDCPIFKKKIVIKKYETVIQDENAISPVGYISLKECYLQGKEWDYNIPLRDKILQLPIMTTTRWIENNLVTRPSELDPPAVEVKDEEEEALNLVMCVPEMKITGQEEFRVRVVDEAFEVGGVIAILSDEMDVKEACNEALTFLVDCLADQDLKCADICSVSLYVGDMSNFSAINEVYKKFFDTNPPVRLCIQANLPRNMALQLDCQGQKLSHEKGLSSRKTMHVQSLSHWAPANIGPYSQAVLAGHKLYIAGVVPLVPSTLQLVQAGISVQCSLALKHLQSIIRAIQPTCTLGCCPLVMCYLTSPDYIQAAMREWDRALEAQCAWWGQRSAYQNGGVFHVAFGIRKILHFLKSTQMELEKPPFVPVVQYCVVPALPKAAKVEWHTYAWPNLKNLEDMQEITLCQEHKAYTIRSRAIYCMDQPDIFSCNIVVDLKDVDGTRNRRIPVTAVVHDLFQEYSQICERCGVGEVMPLAKVLFSPVLFDFAEIQQAFSEASLKVGDSISGTHHPVVSLVSVNSLQSRQQILAWCQ